jgi:uncharacterized protein with PhoU and TrkA domain
VIRDGKRLYGSAQNAVLKDQGVLVLEAVPNAIDEFRSNLNLDFSDENREGTLRTESESLNLSEVIVTDGSRLNGNSVQSVGLAWRYGTILMGASRNGKTIIERLRKLALILGDILLLLSPKENAHTVIEWLNVLPLEDRGHN